MGLTHCLCVAADRTCPPDTFVCESNKGASRYPCISMNLVCDGVRYSAHAKNPDSHSLAWLGTSGVKFLQQCL